MKLFRIWPALVAFIFVILFSCDKENHCETNDYEMPEISILDPADGIVIIPQDWEVPVVRLQMKAEAGLNTLTLLDPWGSYLPVQVYTNGETELESRIELPYVNEGENIFVLHDMCNQRAEVEIRIIME